MKALYGIAMGAVCFWAGRCSVSQAPGSVTATLPVVVTRYDTVSVEVPPPASVRLLAPRRALLACAEQPDSVPTPGPLPDSVAVEVPVESREYAGEGYRAYVSGWQPRLDSLVLERPVYTATVAQPVAARTRRFSIALQAGYGMTPRGLLPYVGVGVSVRLF